MIKEEKNQDSMDIELPVHQLHNKVEIKFILFGVYISFFSVKSTPDLTNRDFVCNLSRIMVESFKYAISELPSASVCERVQVRNLSYENEFDLHLNEILSKTDFHMKGFALELGLKQRQRELGNGLLKHVDNLLINVIT